jgi:MFS family permease
METAKPSPANVSSLVACLIGCLLLRAAAGGVGALVGFFMAKVHVESLAAGGLGVSAFIVGLATALFYTTELLGAPGFGVLSDRHGRRPFLLMSPILGAAAAAVMLALPVLPIVLLSKVFQGVSTAASAPSSLGYFADATVHSSAVRGRVMAFFEIATVLGMIGGIFAAGRLWDRFETLSFALLLVLYFLSWLAFLRVRDVGTRVRAAHSSITSALRLPGVIAFVPAWLAVNAILGAWFAHALFQLKVNDDPSQLLVGGYSGNQISTYMAVVGLLFLIGLAGWGFTLGRTGALRTMRFALVGMAVLCPLLYMLNHSMPHETGRITMLLTLSGLALIVASGFTPAALSHLADVSETGPGQRGAVMGLYSVLFGLGQLLGSMLSAPLVQAFAVDGLILFTLLMAGASAIGVLILSMGSFAPRPAARAAATVEVEAGS